MPRAKTAEELRNRYTIVSIEESNNNEPKFDIGMLIGLGILEYLYGKGYISGNDLEKFNKDFIKRVEGQHK